MEITNIDDEYVEKEFEKIAQNMEKFQNKRNYSICGKDISKIDMSKLSINNFRRLTFDSKTIFSEEQKEKFHPEEILRQGKNFSNLMTEIVLKKN